jgi:hypothetical protein
LHYYSFTHTAAGDAAPWLEVDLGADTAVLCVVLHNRMRAHQRRFRDLVVTLYTDNTTADADAAVNGADGVGGVGVSDVAGRSVVWRSALLNADDCMGTPQHINVPVSVTPQHTNVTAFTQHNNVDVNLSAKSAPSTLTTPSSPSPSPSPSSSSPSPSPSPSPSYVYARYVRISRRVTTATAAVASAAIASGNVDVFSEDAVADRTVLSLSAVQVFSTLAARGVRVRADDGSGSGSGSGSGGLALLPAGLLSSSTTTMTTAMTLPLPLFNACGGAAAARCTATQSSREGDLNGADNALNDDDTCTHTRVDAVNGAAWWRVALPAPAHVKLVTLHNRRDGWHGRLRDVVICLLDADGEEVFRSRVVNAHNCEAANLSFSVHCGGGVTASAVVVRRLACADTGWDAADRNGEIDFLFFFSFFFRQMNNAHTYAHIRISHTHMPSSHFTSFHHFTHFISF